MKPLCTYSKEILGATRVLRTRDLHYMGGQELRLLRSCRDVLFGLADEQVSVLDLVVAWVARNMTTYRENI